MYIADLHIHSGYSRATSRDCDAPHLDLWARNKGIQLVGTGDFTHPAWRQALRESLLPAEDGLYTLRNDLRMTAAAANAEEPARFVVTGEISSIYKKNGKTRKVHNLILLPGLDAADALAHRLETIGNIRSDGRPILGLDSRDLLEITLGICPDAIFIPAHIWTPHFSLFGAFSGFDTIEECFEDLTGEIHALETGLSSDPPMIWRVSALDRFTLVSNSDAHSPAKLGREANLITAPLSYPALKHAIETGDGFAGTLEFFPEEGKYHLDGHRNCGARLDPEESERLNNLCPVCGKRVTIGVQHRAWALSDRPEGYRPEHAKPFESLVPLPEVIAASVGASADSKGVQQQYLRLLETLGAEFSILRELPIEEIERAANACVAEGIRRLRQGRVARTGGYDGEYGKIQLFDDAERERLRGQMALFDAPARSDIKKASRTKAALPAHQSREAPAADAVPNAEKADRLNEAQQRAVATDAPAVAVIAGPGTGKTKTLVSRIAHLVGTCGIDPAAITAVTFTNQAAAEMRARLEVSLGATVAERLTIGTFHAICLRLLDKRPLLTDGDALLVMRGLLSENGLAVDARAALSAISRVKCGVDDTSAGISPALIDAYRERLQSLNVRDLDDLLLDALASEDPPPPCFSYLLVDEFQDINAVQRQLVLKWSANGKSLFVIGDADQSIYGFRGASARCFSELRETLPQLETISLEQNYRSAPQVLACARAVIGHNPGDARQLRAMRPDGAPVRIIRAGDPLTEGSWIAKEIARMAGGMEMHSAQSVDGSTLRPFSDIAVLCRTRRQLARIEECLQHDGIPCVVSGRDDALGEDAVRGALALFRFLLRVDDAAALSACLQLVYGLSDTEASAVRSSVFALTRAGALTAEALPRAGCPAALAADVTELGPLVARESPRRLLERYLASPNRSGREGGRAMEKLMDMAVFHASMEDFLRVLALGEEADINRAAGKVYDSGAVRLMTLHGSKGLEFPVVFLAGLAEGLFPLTREGRCADLEEERRLFFVGITRARDVLILTTVKPPSPFLAELPPELAQESAASLLRIPDSRQLKLF